MKKSPELRVVPNKEDNKYAVEKGVPLPPKGISKKSSKYPYYTMEVGDSFVVEVEERNSIKTSISYFNTVMSKKGLPNRYDWRDVRENGVEYVRIWRVA